MISTTRWWSLGSTAAVGVLLAACQDVGPAVATRIDFVAQPPASAMATQSMAPITVGFLTTDGDTVTTATGSVQISLVTADTAAHLSGTTTATVAGGVATFSDLSVDRAGPAYKLVAKAAGFDSVVSAPFGVTPGPATRIGFMAQPPASVVSTQLMAPITVGYLTADGDIVTSAAGSAQVSLVTADTAAHLSGTTTATIASGVATFSNLSVDKAGTAYKLVAKAVGFDSIVSSPFAITVGPAAKLRFEGKIFEGQVNGAEAGTTLPPVTVSVTDAGGNLVSNATPAITVGAWTVVYGMTMVSAVAGAATFDDLSIRRSGWAALTASSPGLISARTSEFLVWHGPLIKLTFGTQLANGTAGTPLPSFLICCTDQYGNGTASPPGGIMTVTVALGNNPTGATLSGTLTVLGVSAATSFNNVSIDKPGTGYTLVARVVASDGACGTAPPGTSAAFNVSP